MISDESKTPFADKLWLNATVATMREGDTAYGLLEKAAVAVAGGKITWVGPSNEITSQQYEAVAEIIKCDGKLLTPGLIDCHTHLVYGGNRATEFERRLQGISYAEIAKAGGGIASTVRATRECTEEQLFKLAAHRLCSFLNEGVTTVEIKSGYGLDLMNEAKMLRVARRIGEDLPVQVVTTLLGAHALPTEFANDSDGYIEYICDTMLPQIAMSGLADHVDAFCENIAFSVEQVERVFAAAKKFNLPIKLHAEQLSDQKGAVLAASMGALSVDHVEFLLEEDVPKLKLSETVPVLLPGAFYYLRETKLPPVEAFRQNQIPIAIASDSNPGSAPVSSLLLMLNMACTLFRLTPEEALTGVTRNAAKALGIETNVGTIEVGKTANLALWDTANPAELSYGIGCNLLNKVMYLGELR